MFSLIHRSFTNKKDDYSRQKTIIGCHTKGASKDDDNKAENESNGSIYSKNKDSIESEFEVLDNGDLFPTKKSFSKVVEPINSQIMMTIKKNQTTEEDQMMMSRERRKEVRFDKDYATTTGKNYFLNGLFILYAI